MSWAPHHADRKRDDFPDITLLRALGALTYAASQLDTIAAQPPETESRQPRAAEWYAACRNALADRSRIIGALGPAAVSSNVIVIVVPDGSRVAVDASYIDRLANRMVGLIRTGLATGLLTAHHIQPTI